MTVLEKQVPTLRFPDFDEKVSFNPLISLSVDGIKNGISNNPGRNQYDIKHINVVNLYSEDIIHTEDLEYIDVTNNKFLNYKVEYGDVFFTRSSLVLEGIAKCNINIDSESNLVFDDHIMRIRPDKNMIDPMYLKIFCSTYRARKYFMERAKTATMTTIGQNDISNLPVSVVSLEEQQKIGNFFRCLDQRIVAEEKKLGLLQVQKKEYTKKFFSQELRFKGENGDTFPAWQEKQLLEVAEIVGGGTPETSVAEYWNGNISWFTPTEIKREKYASESERLITKLGLMKSSAKMLPAGSILLTSRATLGDMAITLKPVATNQGFQSLVPKSEIIDTDFLYYHQDSIKDYCYKYASGSTFLEISKTVLGKYIINVPILEEQKMIGKFLSLLDSKIKRQHRLTELLKHQKQALMQQMFV